MQQLLPRATLRHRYGIRPSLGDAAEDVQRAGAITAPVASTVAAGSVASVLGISAAAAVPIIGAAIVGVTLAITAILRSGCGKSCIITSNWANEAEALLQKNIQTYFSLPAPRLRVQQQAALENFDKVWNYLVQECSQVAGGAGQNCINDRKAGACKWKQTSDSPLLQYPGEPQPGECWNWFSGYRDPIAHDTQVTDAVPDTGVGQSLSNAGQQLMTTLQSSPLLLIGGVALLSFALLSGKD